MQLKMQKERKKVDKVVFDSEERAFWRQRRPGQPNALDEHIQKTEKKLKKCTLQGYRQQLERLRLSLKTKPWLKAMKASDTMVSWCEQFQDYDPFLAPSQPSNPWISDDTSLWTLNTDNVEVPTERRVKRWGLSVQELVRDPIGRQVLETFLESEFSSENIRFWMAIQDLKYSPNCQIECKAQKVHDEYLASGALAK
uniref:RGS domain-containing protein n=1 Tax=Ditylenchus dipsaci TaxID=166011 RepID=A0A915E5H6_9BILA